MVVFIIIFTFYSLNLQKKTILIMSGHATKEMDAGYNYGEEKYLHLARSYGKLMMWFFLGI